MNGRYEIKDKIGEGGVGAVHVAFDRELNRNVAVKRLRSQTDSGSESISSQADDLIKEALTLSAFQHPNIVTVYDVGKDDDGAFVVMELLQGKTLDTLVEEAPLSIDDFLELARQTLDGMIAAQSRGMVHRDLKPGNVMVERLPSGKLQSKILDFGLAKFSKKASRQTQDQEAGILGSLHFMAPEQFERAPLDGRTDIYALGCIYYYSLAGSYPFDGETGAVVMASHLKHDVTHLGKARTETPKWLADWVMWLINRSPENRPRDAKTALERFMTLGGGNASVQTKPPAPPKAPVGLPPGAVPVAPAPPNAVPVPSTPSATAPLTPAPPAATQPLAPPMATATAPLTAVPPAAPYQAPAQQAPPTQQASPATHSIPSRRPQKRKSPAGLFIILMLSAILIGTAIWGVFVYSDKKEEKLEAETYNRLVKQDEPKGDPSAVVILAKMMAKGGKVEKNSVSVLEKLEGPGVKRTIVDQIGVTSAGTRVNLIGVAVKRRLPRVTKSLIEATGTSTEAAVREAALTGLIELAEADELDAILGLIKKIPTSKDGERRLLAEAVFTAASRDTGSRGSVRLISALSSFAEVDNRSIVVKVLGRLGGDEALSILEAELDKENLDAQRAAVGGLSQWPNGKAATVLSDYSESATDPSLKELAMKGFVQVIGRSGDLPGEKKVQQLMKAIKSVQSSTTKRALFLELAKIPDEAALDFLADLYDNAEDRKTESYAEQAERLLAELMPRVIDIDDVEVLLDAEKATLTTSRGLYFNRIENTIQNWDQPSAWVIWHVRIIEPGNYLVEVIQAHDGKPDNTYEVHFGGSTLPCEVKTTASREEFENVEAGTVEIAEPGLYELIVKPIQINGNSVMTLRGIALVNEN